MPRLIVSAFLLLLLAGCQSAPSLNPEDKAWARFFLEASETVAGLNLELPRSGVRIDVNLKPVITEGDIVNVELVQVDLGKCLMFQLTPAAARDFYRLSASHQGRRLVLMINDAALGARRIDGAIFDGVVYVFAEVAEDELPALASRLKKSSMAFQRALARKG